MLAEANGPDLGRAIQAESSISDVEMILRTAIGRSGDAELSKEIGFRAYLTKPVAQDALIDCLRVVLGQALDSAENPEANRPLVTKHLLAEMKIDDKRILLVEDTHVDQKVAVSMLRKLGRDG